MIRKIFAAAMLSTAISSPVLARNALDASDSDKATDDSSIIVTAARTILPPSALPLTIKIIDKRALDQQIAIAGSVTDAVASLTPSFSPTRQKL